MVICPINSCCGSSRNPISPLRVQITRTGILNGKFKDVSGLTALPKPEFCIIAIPLLFPSQTPDAIATASPSLLAGMYSNLSFDITSLIKGVRKEQGTPE